MENYDAVNLQLNGKYYSAITALNFKAFFRSSGAVKMNSIALHQKVSCKYTIHRNKAG